MITANALTFFVNKSQTITVAICCYPKIRTDFHNFLFDMGERFFFSRIGLVIGERAVHLEAEPRGPAGEAIEDARGHDAADAAPGVEHHVEGFHRGRLDERHHVLDVRVEQGRPGRPGGLRGGQRYVRITLRSHLNRRELTVLLAHELQHALVDLLDVMVEHFRAAARRQHRVSGDLL